MSELQQYQSQELAMIEVQAKKWDLLQRKAMAYSQSNLVPTQYRAQLEKKEHGKVVGYGPNPAATANCIIAMDMADRMKANELMVMQNLYVIEGRPSWSSQWVIAMINGCGKFTPLRFKIEDLGDREVSYFEYVYNPNTKKREAIAKTIKIHDFSCIAYATDKESNIVLESSKVSIEIAVKEGWFTKTGSKWQTMPEMMLRYRAASFFGSIYAPELKMGLTTVEESQDISDRVDLSGKYPDAIIPTDPQSATDIPDESGETQSKIKCTDKQEQPPIVDGIDQSTGEVINESEEIEINPEAQKKADSLL